MVGREYPPFVIGGAGIHMYHLVHALRQRGHRVDVISFGYRDKLVWRENRRGFILFLNPKSSVISSHDEGIKRDIYIPLDIIKLTSFTKNLIHQEEYDIVHIQEPYVGGIISHRNKITTIHDTSYGEIRAIFHTRLNSHNLKRAMFFATIGYAMEYFSLVTSRVVITPSPQVRNELAYIYHAGKLTNIVVIPNGVEPPKPNEPEKNDAKKLLGFQDKLIIFTTSQHIARKRLETLIEAIAILKQKWLRRIVVLIGGLGPLTSHLKSLVKKKDLEDTIIFTGWIPRKKLPLYYKAADVFVITSEYEAGPLTLLEAGIREVAIVSTKIAGFPALLKHGVNALLFEVNDYKSLANHLNLLLEDNVLRTRLGRNAKKFAETFTWDKIAMLTEAVYHKVINRE